MLYNSDNYISTRLSCKPTPKLLVLGWTYVAIMDAKNKNYTYKNKATMLHFSIYCSMILKRHRQYLFSRALASCSSPRNFTASMMAVQVGGGSTLFSHTSSIATRQRWGLWGCFDSMLPRLLISKWTSITFHLSATLW